MFRIRDDEKGTRSALAMLLGSCFLCGLILAYVIAGIYFLAVDHYEGGDCAKTSGYQVWIYCLMYFVLGPILSVAIQGIGAITNRSVGAFGFLLLSAFFIIYGAIVLYFPGPCADFKNTGIWQWAQVAFSLQCFIYVGVLCALIYFINSPAAPPKVQDPAASPLTGRQSQTV